MVVIASYATLTHVTPRIRVRNFLCIKLLAMIRAISPWIQKSQTDAHAFRTPLLQTTSEVATEEKKSTEKVKSIY
jgi:hypothetical protein